VKEKGDSDVLDAAMIANAQRVEHYEIAGYGCVRTYARMLGREQDVTLIQQTLDEEGATDESLTQLAERVINIDAMRDM
jgi:ferritin-like metal-binding protein YciE